MAEPTEKRKISIRHGSADRFAASPAAPVSFFMLGSRANFCLYITLNVATEGF